jgi:hypothetical protein
VLELSDMCQKREIWAHYHLVHKIVFNIDVLQAKLAPHDACAVYLEVYVAAKIILIAPASSSLSSASLLDSPLLCSRAFNC